MRWFWQKHEPVEARKEIKEIRADVKRVAQRLNSFAEALELELEDDGLEST